MIRAMFSGIWVNSSKRAHKIVHSIAILTIFKLRNLCKNDRRKENLFKFDFEELTSKMGLKFFF